MICPDCEQETDKLMKLTNSCVQCYKRYQNKKSRKQVYVPLKDIKGTPEYNRVMGKRHSVIKEEPEIIEDLQETISNKIKDILIENKVDVELVDLQSVLLTLNLLKQFTYNFEQRKQQTEQAIKVIDMFKTDIQHKIENSEIGTEEYKRAQDEFYYLLKDRRKYKNSSNIMNEVNGLIYILNNIPNFSNTLSAHVSQLEKIKEYQENPVYHCKADKDMIDNEQFKEYNKKEFEVDVVVTGISNSKKPKHFIRTVKAINKYQAEKMVRTFILTRYKNVKLHESNVVELNKEESDNDN